MSVPASEPLTCPCKPEPSFRHSPIHAVTEETAYPSTSVTSNPSALALNSRLQLLHRVRRPGGIPYQAVRPQTPPEGNPYQAVRPLTPLGGHPYDAVHLRAPQYVGIKSIKRGAPPPSTPPRQHYWNLSNPGDSRRSMALAVALCIATDRRCSNIAAVLCPHTCGSVLRVSCRLAAVASKSVASSMCFKNQGDEIQTLIFASDICVEVGALLNVYIDR